MRKLVLLLMMIALAACSKAAVAPDVMQGLENQQTNSAPAQREALIESTRVIDDSAEEMIKTAEVHMVEPKLLDPELMEPTEQLEPESEDSAEILQPEFAEPVEILEPEFAEPVSGEPMQLLQPDTMAPAEQVQP